MNKIEDGAKIKVLDIKKMKKIFEMKPEINLENGIKEMIYLLKMKRNFLMSNGKCRISGENLIEVLDLGNQYISDFVKKGDEKIIYSSLKLGIRVKLYSFLKLILKTKFIENIGINLE